MQQRTNFAALTLGLTRGAEYQAAIMAYFNQLAGTDVLTDVPKYVGDIVRYHLLDINGEKSVTFFDTGLGSPSALSTNMGDSFTSKENEHMIVTAIEYLESDTTAATADLATFTKGIANAQLVTSQMSILSGGSKTMQNWAMSDFLAVTNEGLEGTVDLAVPQVWLAQTDYPIQVKARGTNAFTAANTNLFVICKVRGVGLLA